MYSVNLSESAQQFFEAASAKLQQRLDRGFEQLKINPKYHPNIKALKGNLTSFYRYRVGDYRITYQINDETMQVLVATIKHRSEAYE